MCKHDLFFLGTTVLGLGGEKIDKVFHGWLCQTLMPEENLLLLVPREHTKTTWLQVSVVQTILRHPESSILLASLTADLSEQSLKVVQSYLMNEKLTAMFPDILWEDAKSASAKGQTIWTAKKLRVKRNIVKGTETLEAAGMGKTITGKHFDFVFLDDIINEKMVATENQAMKALLWVQMLSPIKNVGCVMRIFGTRYDMSDIYGWWIKQAETGKLSLKIVERKVETNGKFIYSYFNEQVLAEKRAEMTNSYLFSCQYYNDPNPVSERVFKPPFLSIDEQPRGLRYLMTVDPSYTVTKGADFTGIVICGYDNQNHVWVVYAKRHKMPPLELFDLIYVLYREWDLEVIGIEETIHRDTLRPLLNYYLMQEKKEVLPIKEIKVSNEANSKHRRIMSLQPYYAKGIVTHVEGRHKEDEPGNCDDLEREMIYYPGNTRSKDDVLDALSMQPTIIRWAKTERAPVERRPMGQSYMETVFKQKKERSSYVCY